MMRTAVSPLLLLSVLLYGVAGMRVNKNTAVEISSSVSGAEQEAGRPKLKVGMKVKIIRENDRWRYSAARVGTKGMKGTILQIDTSMVPIEVELSNGQKQWYKERWLADVPENHPDWLATTALKVNANCSIIEGAEARNSLPYPDCKCENKYHAVYCRGQRMAERKFNLTHVAEDLSLCQVAAKCEAEPVCEDIEGAEGRAAAHLGHKGWPQCKCKYEDHKVKCDDTVIAPRKFSGDYVYGICAQPKCVGPPKCEDMVEGSEGRRSEYYPQCKCKDDDHKVKCDGMSVSPKGTVVAAASRHHDAIVLNKVLADRKFSAEEVLDVCAKPKCEPKPVCEDIAGAEGRGSEAYPQCKCKDDDHRVKCEGEPSHKVIGDRKFSADDVYAVCAKPKCEHKPVCDDIEGATARRHWWGGISAEYPQCKCKDYHHKVICNSTEVGERKFSADDAYAVCDKPRCALHGQA